MKRTRLVVAAVLLVVVSFGAGTAIKLKFPYVSEALNKPCGKTEFEWRCLKKSVFQKREAIVLTREFELLHFEGRPAPAGLVVLANLTRRKGIKNSAVDKNWRGVVHNATNHIYTRILRDFGEGKGLKKPFAEWRNLRLELYLDGKIIGTRNADGLKLKAAPF